VSAAAADGEHPFTELPTERHAPTRNRPLSRQLLEADEQVRDVPAALSAQVRERMRPTLR
jgi:hypothetical protein